MQIDPTDNYSVPKDTSSDFFGSPEEKELDRSEQYFYSESLHYNEHPFRFQESPRAPSTSIRHPNRD